LKLIPSKIKTEILKKAYYKVSNQHYHINLNKLIQSFCWFLFYFVFTKLYFHVLQIKLKLIIKKWLSFCTYIQKIRRKNNPWKETTWCVCEGTILWCVLCCKFCRTTTTAGQLMPFIKEVSYGTHMLWFERWGTHYHACWIRWHWLRLYLCYGVCLFTSSVTCARVCLTSNKERCSLYSYLHVRIRR